MRRILLIASREISVQERRKIPAVQELDAAAAYCYLIAAVENEGKNEGKFYCPGIQA